MKISNQGLIDPETFFKRDHDRDEKILSRGSRIDWKFQIKVWSFRWLIMSADGKKNRDILTPEKGVFQVPVLWVSIEKSDRGWKIKIKVWLIGEWFSTEIVIVIEIFQAGAVGSIEKFKSRFD